MDWNARNCDRCVKRCRDQEAHISPCDIENGIWQSMVTGDMPRVAAERMGYKSGAYTWRCPGFDDDPGVWCGHCLRPVETEDELFVSERCGKCGGALTPATTMDKGQLLERRKADDEAERAAIACGLIIPKTGEAEQAGGDGGGAGG
jgi:hypothetical protein